MSSENNFSHLNISKIENEKIASNILKKYKENDSSEDSDNEMIDLLKNPISFN